MLVNKLSTLLTFSKPPRLEKNENPSHALEILTKSLQEEVAALERIKVPELVDEPGSSEQRMALIGAFKDYYHMRIPFLVPNAQGALEIHTVRSLIDSRDPSHTFETKETHLRTFLTTMPPVEELSLHTPKARAHWANKLGYSFEAGTTQEKQELTLLRAYEEQQNFFAHLSEKEYLALAFLSAKSRHEGKEQSFKTLHTALYSLQTPIEQKRQIMQRISNNLENNADFQELHWMYEQMHLSSLDAFPRLIPQDLIKKPIPHQAQEQTNNTITTTLRSIKRSILAVTTLVTVGVSMHSSTAPTAPVHTDPVPTPTSVSTYTPEVSPEKKIYSPLQQWVINRSPADQDQLLERTAQIMTILESHGGISQERLQELMKRADAQGIHTDHFLLSLITLPQGQGNGFSQNYIAHLQRLHNMTSQEVYASPQWQRAYQQNFRKEQGRYVNTDMKDTIFLGQSAFLGPNGMVVTQSPLS